MNKEFRMRQEGNMYLFETRCDEGEWKIYCAYALNNGLLPIAALHTAIELMCSKGYEWKD